MAIPKYAGRIHGIVNGNSVKDLSEYYKSKYPEYKITVKSYDILPNRQKRYVVIMDLKKKYK